MKANSIGCLEQFPNFMLSEFYYAIYYYLSLSCDDYCKYSKRIHETALIFHQSDLHVEVNQAFHTIIHFIPTFLGIFLI